MALALLMLPLLAACGRHGGYGYAGGAAYGGGNAVAGSAPSRYYPPPGPPEDPWGPYIREASARYRVPERWVRAVMQQESGGREQAISPVGAMGLMQVMPETYDGLRARYGLGDDPYDPHNNILAGTAYIREMYDRFGAPGFLAAYNAGPDRVDSYLAGTDGLPNETVNYLAAIAPNLGHDLPLSGPLAMYASASPGGFTGAGPSVASLAAGCDVNAAYDPDHPCAPLEQAAVTPVLQTATNGCDADAAYDPDRPCAPSPPQPEPAVQQASAGGCDPDAAFNPDAPPCQAAPPGGGALPQPVTAQPLPTVTASALYQPAPPAARPAPAPLPALTSAAPPAASLAAPRAAPSGTWAIQVGAFANPGLARAVAEGARAEAPDQLRSAVLALPTIVSLGGSVLYRARLASLSAGAASNACKQLNQRQLPCLVVQPSGSETSAQGT